MRGTLALLGIVVVAAVVLLLAAALVAAGVLWLATLLARSFDVAVWQAALLYVAIAYALFRLLLGLLVQRADLPFDAEDWDESDEEAPEPPQVHVWAPPIGAGAQRPGSRRRGKRR